MTSLDMRTSVFFTTMLFGCKLHFQPLTPEEEEKVDDSIYRASLIQPYVISLAEAAGENIFNAEGECGAPSFVNDLNTTHQNVREFRENDLIVTYRLEDIPGASDECAYFHVAFGPNRIGINKDYLDDVTSLEAGCLIEEAAHVIADDHPERVEEAIDRYNGNPSEEALDALMEAIVEEKDYAKLLGAFFYEPADSSFLIGLEREVGQEIDTYFTEIEEGIVTPQSAYDSLYSTYLTATESQWVQTEMGSLHRSFDYYQNYLGISEDDISSALTGSDFYEWSYATAQAEIDAFVAAFPDEDITTVEEQEAL